MKLNTVEVIFRISSNKKGTGVDVTRVGELVRCKDCWWRHDGTHTPSMWLPCDEVVTENDWFCAYGKREGNT